MLKPRSFLGSVLPLMTVASVLSACAGDQLSDASSFEEFEAATYHEPWSGGVYIVDGDTAVVDAKALRELWENRFAPGQGLIVNTDGGLDAKWNGTQQHHLTYCIDNAFGARKADVIAAIAAATDEGWETFADVDFIYTPAEDAACTPANEAVVFDVRPVSGQPYLARAFFPNNPRAARSVLIDATAFGEAWPLSHILGHELGHALGFRHEHTRPEAAVCFEDDNWRPLTPYDSASVMHYPQCNGTSADLAFTALDAQGAASLYGAPGSPPPPPSQGEPRSTHEAGSATAGQWVSLAPIAVSPGSRFEVTMTGTGDPDLYVRFDSTPTKTVFDCRPYLDGPEESCAVDVPVTATAAHIAIYGFTDSHFDLAIRWLAPASSGAGQLVINELLADPGSVVDANGDGVVSTTDDEMIELVNIGGASLDLGRATIADAISVRVTLPEGTIIGPGEVLVVFGGGTPQPLGDGVHVATGRLSLNNDGDTITIRDRTSAELARVTYGSIGTGARSIVRATDLDPAASFVAHTTVSSLRASPGRRSDGLPF